MQITNRSCSARVFITALHPPCDSTSLRHVIDEEAETVNILTNLSNLQDVILNFREDKSIAGLCKTRIYNANKREMPTLRGQN